MTQRSWLEREVLTVGRCEANAVARCKLDVQERLPMLREECLADRVGVYRMVEDADTSRVRDTKLAKDELPRFAFEAAEGARHILSEIVAVPVRIEPFLSKDLLEAEVGCEVLVAIWAIELSTTAEDPDPAVRMVSGKCDFCRLPRARCG